VKNYYNGNNLFNGKTFSKSDIKYKVWKSSKLGLIGNFVKWIEYEFYIGENTNTNNLEGVIDLDNYNTFSSTNYIDRKEVNYNLFIINYKLLIMFKLLTINYYLIMKLISRKKEQNGDGTDLMLKILILMIFDTFGSAKV
jgi:hypothetical protein